MKILYWLFVYALRFITMHSPFQKGKSRLSNLQKRIICDKIKLNKIRVRSKIGTIYELKLPEDKVRLNIFTIGYCEKKLSEFLSKIISPDDVLFDIGANIGWYTTLFARAGSFCHSFEPNAGLCRRLERNCKLNEIAHQCKINCCAVSDKRGEATFYTFQGLHHGYSSLANFGRNDSVPHLVRTTTIDEYIAAGRLPKVDLLKIDVEGAELQVLKGGRALFQQEPGPVLVLELNRKACLAFGYSPAEIAVFLHGCGYMIFALADHLPGLRLTKLNFKEIEAIERANVVACKEILLDKLVNFT